MSSTSINTQSPSSHVPRRPPLFSVWHRMSWKEFRQNLPVLGIFVVGLLMTLAIARLSLDSLNVNASDIADFWFGTIYFFVPVFALCIGVFIFAPEKENRTAQFLGILPVSSGQVVFAKLVIGLLTIVLFVILGVCLHLLGPVLFGEQTTIFAERGSTVTDSGLSFSDLFGQKYLQTTPLVTLIILTLECFFWGAICSLIFRRTIFAAVMAGACFALVSWGLPTAIGAAVAQRSLDGPPSKSLFSNSFFTIFLISKALTYAAMGFGLVHLGSRWLGHLPSVERKTLFGRKASASLDGIGSQSNTLSSLNTDRVPTNSRVYFSLIWQSFRQFRTTFLFAMLGAAPLLLGFLLIAATIKEFEIDTLFVAYSLAVALIAIPLIASMFVFLVDHQDRNYRFFQEHREFGRKLWLARLLPAALLTMVCGSLLSTGAVVASWDSWMSNPGLGFIWFSNALIASFAVFCAFAIGQFNSMFLRSGVFIVVSVFVMSGLLIACASWICFLDERLVAFLLPVPLAMLAITWWRAPHWIADRHRVANLVLPWVTLGIVIVGSLVAIASFRVASVPPTGYSLEEQKANFAALVASPDSQTGERPPKFERAILLRNAANAMVATEGISEAYNLRLFLGPTIEYSKKFDFKNPEPLRKFVAQNQKSLRLIELADEQPETSQPVFDPESISSRFEHVAKISLLMSAQATIAEWDGDLELALDYWLQLKRFTDQYDVESSNALLGLFRWSGLPGQSPELIKRAIKETAITPEQWRVQTKILTQSRKLDFANWYEGLVTGNSVADPPLGIDFNYGVNSRRNKSNSSGLLIPWELERSRRLAFVAIEEFEMVRLSGSNYAKESATSSALPMGGTLDYQDNFNADPYRERRELSELFSLSMWMRYWEYIAVLRQIQTQRYARVRMALNGWKLENSDYPDQLADLVPSYFETLPLDVLYGFEFSYSPDGQDAKVLPYLPIWNHRGSSEDETWELQKQFYDSMIEPGQPFLLPWSLFRKPTKLTCTVTDEPGIEKFECYDYSGQDNIAGYFTSYPNNWDFVLPSKEKTESDEIAK